MTVKLFVGGLSFSTSSERLREAFAGFGEVQSATVVMDRDTGRPRGFAFVTMATVEGAQKATSALNGAEVGARFLTVSEARPRQERSGFGGGQSRSKY